MNSERSYTYIVLRYVHDVVTGEFVNAGVLMFAPKRNYLKIKTRNSIGRIRHIFPDLNRYAFLTSMRSVDRAARKVADQLKKEGSLFPRFATVEDVARSIVITDDSSLQWSAVSGGVSDDFEKSFARLYSRLVTRYDATIPHRRSDEDIWRPVRAMLEQQAVPVEFSEKTIVGRTDEISFKRAWRNGHWHAYEPVSFDLADAEGIKDKARRWRGHLEAVHEGSSEKLKLNFIVGAPQSAELIPAYQNAIKILGEASFKPSIYEETDIPRLVSSIEDKARAHIATQSAVSIPVRR